MIKLLILPILIAVVCLVFSSKMTSSQNFRAACENALNITQTYTNLPNSSNLIASTKTKINKSLQILEESLKLYEHDQIALSYNGGKDCLVMLVLYLAQISKHYQGNPPFDSILTVLINDEVQFPELIEFIESSSKKYGLNIVRYNNTLKQGFAEFLQEHPSIKSVIVGTRRSDPYASNLKDFQETDNDWPKFVRVNPMLDWYYDEIWSFLKELTIDYCPLYDLGYTSIGGVGTTVRNPHLSQQDGTYLPAFELKGEHSDDVERDGRIKRRN